jgi:hypothetical protein
MSNLVRAMNRLGRSTSAAAVGVGAPWRILSHCSTWDWSWIASGLVGPGEHRQSAVISRWAAYCSKRKVSLPRL